MDSNEDNITASGYKKYHESFMQNNHGSTATHTFLCIMFTVQCSLYCILAAKPFVTRTYRIIYEYFVIILPMILAYTVLAEYIYVLNCLIFIMMFKLFVYYRSKLDIAKNFKSVSHCSNNKIHSITFMRGLTYLITVFCILAVDFRLFPRNLAKTESYGYSLMDTGVGLFVLMSGLVHKDLIKTSLSTIFRRNIKLVSVLVVLGIARYVSVKQLNYQEHVTEYGVHWNFFFTLAICKLLSTIILLYCRRALLISLILLVFHELFLYIGLENWVFSNTPRMSFVNANREGIASSLGYITLYLFGAYLGKILNNKTEYRYQIQLKMLVVNMLTYTSTIIISYFRPTSRTLANAGYCVFIESILLTVINVIYFIQTLFDRTHVKFTVPVILSAINENGLIYFLSANLCTGAINLTARTFFVSPWQTVLILNFYMIFTTILIIFIQKKGIRI